MYSVNGTLYTIQCTLYSVHCVLCKSSANDAHTIDYVFVVVVVVQCIVYIVHSVQCTLYSSQLYNWLRKLLSIEGVTCVIT